METNTTTVTSTKTSDTSTVQPGATEQRTTAANRAPTEPRLQLLFTLKEAAASAGMSHWTLRFWVRRGWLQVARRDRVGRGKEFNAWTVVGLSLLAALNAKVRKNEKSYLDRGTIRALAILADQDDALLLSEDQQDMHVAERAAAKAGAAIGVSEMTPNMVRHLEHALAAIDQRAREGLPKVSKRMSGERL